jgi:hypothetical protein
MAEQELQTGSIAASSCSTPVSSDRLTSLPEVGRLQVGHLLQDGRFEQATSMQLGPGCKCQLLNGTMSKGEYG